MALGEFDIIARYFTRPTKGGYVLLGVGDDAAVLATRADRRLAAAMDTIVEGVHFPAGANAADIGYRAVAANLSDMAAMGAVPVWMTLSLSLPRADEEWLARFAEGLFEAAAPFGLALVGGDTVRGPLVITVQIAGEVEPDKWLTRSGARPGDLVCVSGAPGEAAAGLAVIQHGLVCSHGEQLKARFLRPAPRVELGRALRTIATAAMDVSDGVYTDLEKLCAASGVGASLDLDALPISASLRECFDEDACIRFAAAGGDDYELLFTLRPQDVNVVDALTDLPISCIGRITSGRGVQCLRNGAAVPAPPGGYDHFGLQDATS